MNETPQFALLGDRRFGPLFVTQFFGALNDNVFRAALSLIFVYGGLIANEQTSVFVNAAAGLFVLPFFLFSALAGQLADKLEKSRLVRYLKRNYRAISPQSANRPSSSRVCAMQSNWLWQSE